VFMYDICQLDETVSHWSFLRSVEIKEHMQEDRKKILYGLTKFGSLSTNSH